MNPVIRSFSLGDSVQLRAAIDAVCTESRWMLATNFQPTKEWTHALTHPVCDRHLLLIVEVDCVIVGWCRVFPTTSCADDPLDYSLGIGVLEAYRDRGLGTSLINATLRWAKSSDARQVMLDTRNDNRHAIHVFEKSGFQLCGQPANNLLRMKYVSRTRHWPIMIEGVVTCEQPR